MKIALVDLCKAEDFAQSRSYQDSMSFLADEKIEYLDFASGANDLSSKVDLFHKALESEASLIWFVRGGHTCVSTLNAIDWDKVAKSNKQFYGLSDFTHFSTVAVSKGMTCLYGQGLNYIKEFYAEEADRQFIAHLLKTSEPVCVNPMPLTAGSAPIEIIKEKIIGGYLPAFNLLQNKLQINLADRYVFIEYHSSAIGETLTDLGFLLNQLMYVMDDNRPKGIILGHIELTKEDRTQISTEEINSFCVSRFSEWNLPVYFIDHFKNTLKFS